MPGGITPVCQRTDNEYGAAVEWDFLDLLKTAAFSFEAVITVFLGAVAFISMFGLGMAFLKPSWVEKRKRIEGRTELPDEHLDGLFKG